MEKPKIGKLELQKTRNSTASKLKHMFILLFFGFSLNSFAQVNAGEDVTISAGLPVELTGAYNGFVGIPVTAQDDYFVGPFDIGFDFPFFDGTYDQFAVGPNGILSFDVPDILGFSYWDPVSIPTNTFEKSILGPYQDLFSRPTNKHSNYIYYKTVGQAPDRRLILGWCEAPMFSCASQQSTLQIVIHENGTIENHLIEKPACEANLGNKATQGVNLNDDTGIPVSGRNNQPWIASHESWEFTPLGTDDYDIQQIDFDPEIIVPSHKLSWTWYKESYPNGEVIGTNQSLIVYPTETTKYIVEISLCGGMKYTDEVEIKTIPVATAFNPNSNVEVNRVFTVFANPLEKLAKYSLVIFDRWGKEVYTTNDILKGWDGTDSGSPCNAGVYVWIIKYEGENGTVSNKGTVTLVK
jgi:gliding motility-associated-like protein